MKIKPHHTTLLTADAIITYIGQRVPMNSAEAFIIRSNVNWLVGSGSDCRFRGWLLDFVRYAFRHHPAGRGAGMARLEAVGTITHSICHLAGRTR